MMLELLRKETRRLHEETERAMDLPSRLSSESAYADLLSRLYAVVAPLEHGLDALRLPSALGLDLERRRKAHLLRADLLALGRDAVPRPAPPPRLPDTDAAMGCLYVLEGSTLGGQIIRRQVQARLGLGPDRGCSYFAGYGAGTGPMWKAYCAALGRYGETRPEAGAALVAAAADTFRRFQECIAC